MSVDPSLSIADPPSPAETEAAGYVPFTAYDASGRVVAVGFTPESSLERGIPGLSLLLGTRLDPATEYVNPDTGERMVRPSLTLAADKTRIGANGADIATITGIPAGATIVVRGETFTADGDPLEYATVQPGLHRLRVDAFPAREATVDIHAD